MSELARACDISGTTAYKYNFSFGSVRKQCNALGVFHILGARCIACKSSTH